MPEFQFRVTDDRGSAAGVFFVFTTNEERARELARHVLDESPHNVALEALDESGRPLFCISRPVVGRQLSGGRS
jgi:hypothetical protein